MAQTLIADKETVEIWSHSLRDYFLQTYAKDSAVLGTYKAITQKAFNLDEHSYDQSMMNLSLERFLAANLLDSLQIYRWIQIEFDLKKGPQQILTSLHHAYLNHKMSEGSLNMYLLVLAGALPLGASNQTITDSYFDFVKNTFQLEKSWEERVVSAALSANDNSYLNRIDSFINQNAPHRILTFAKELEKQIIARIPKSTVSETGRSMLSWVNFIRTSLAPTAARPIFISMSKYIFAQEHKNFTEPADRRNLFLVLKDLVGINDPEVRNLPIWQELAKDELHLYSEGSHLDDNQKRNLYFYATELNEEKLFNKSTMPSLQDLMAQLTLPALRYSYPMESSHRVSLNAETMVKWVYRVIDNANFSSEQLRVFLIEYGQAIAQGRRLSKFLPSDGAILLIPFIDHWINSDDVLASEFAQLYENDGEFRELWKNAKKTFAHQPTQKATMEAIDSNLPGFCKLALRKLVK
jgi:hypothetical protein